MEKSRIVFLAIFPLQIAIFPYEEVPLHIFEPRYKELIVECRDAGITFGIPTYINGRLSRYGTEVRLERILHTADDGQMDIIVKGLRIFEIEAFQEEVPGRLYSGASVRWLEDESNSAPAALRERAAALFNQIQRYLDVDRRIDSPYPTPLSWQIAPYVGLPLGNRVELLSMTDEAERLETLIRHMERARTILRQRRGEDDQVARRDYILNAGNRLN